MDYRHGFRAEAERLAIDVRREMGLSPYVALDPIALAAHLAVPVWPLSALYSQGEATINGALDCLLHDAPTVLSAVTVFDGPRRVVIHNDAHPPLRRTSNITHELSHGLLLHEPQPALDGRGCRDWRSEIEAEASFLSGVLLLPAQAARGAAKRGLSVEEIAMRYGISIEMARWRVNITGARRLLAS